MPKLINLTPHSVKLVDVLTQSEEIVKEHKRLRPIRVIQSSRTVGHIDFKSLVIPVKLILPHRMQDGAILPPMDEETIYIVSRVVAECYKDIRPDFVFPYDFQRNETGGILGCHSLAKFNDGQ